VRPYTFVQLFEVLLFGAVVIYGTLATPDRHPSLVVAGAGLLLGKAVLNILAPEGGSLIRRSLVGYAAGAVFAGLGIVLIHTL